MVIAEIDPEPDQPGATLFVGQDRAGHWLVQETHGRLGGRFISRDAALRFARAERHALPGAEVVIASHPLVPDIPFDPVGADERALARAA